MLDEELYYTLRRRLIKLEEQVNEPWADYFVKQDLKKMLKTVRAEFTLLDRELVNCRRMRKYSSQYQAIEEACEQLLANLEKRITWARLL